MRKESGRPRDPRIEDDVLDATLRLLEEVSYTGLSIAAIARRAGTTRPAIYRRWPGKAHLVHEALFPVGEVTTLPGTGNLIGDVCEMLRRTVAVMTAPPVRTALPGLIGEMTADPALHAVLLERFHAVLWQGLEQRLAAAIARGEVRADITAVDVVEALAGITLMAIITRNAELDDAWIEHTAVLITRGISR